MENYVSVWPVLVLAFIHFFGTKLRFLAGVPRSIWLSGAGGVSVAYVFLHLFPELGEGQKYVEKFNWAEKSLGHHVYLMALVGLSVFYGIERAVVTVKREQMHKTREKEPETPAGVFWLHIGSFAIYNALIGYILFQREEGPTQALLLFSIAMALYFLINDFSLTEYHQQHYTKFGRWVLVLALVAGWATGFIVELPKTVIVLVMAFVGGGVILNVLKEELPEERESRYWAFVLGAFLYAILLLSL
jgi:zinc transporter ZupT